MEESIHGNAFSKIGLLARKTIPNISIKKIMSMNRSTKIVANVALFEIFSLLAIIYGRMNFRI